MKMTYTLSLTNLLVIIYEWKMWLYKDFTLNLYEKYTNEHIREHCYINQYILQKYNILPTALLSSLREAFIELRVTNCDNFNNV
jgi:hypothetical protein